MTTLRQLPEGTARSFLATFAIRAAARGEVDLAAAVLAPEPPAKRPMEDDEEA